MYYFDLHWNSNLILEEATRHIFVLEEKVPPSKELSMSIQRGGVTMWYIYYTILLLLLSLQDVMVVCGVNDTDNYDG